MGLSMQTTPPRKFTKGLNLFKADVDVAYDELLKATNCRIQADRILTAPGFQKYSTTQLAGRVKTIWGNKLGSSYPLIVAAGGTVYSASSGVYTSVKSGLNASLDLDIERYSQRLFCGNGSDDNFKIDSTLTASNHGIVAPTTNPTLTEINPGAGVFPNGEVRKFYVTFWDDTHKVESNPNPTAPSITIAAGPSNIRISNFPLTTDPNVTHYRVYMTENNGAAWFRILELSYAVYSVGPYDIVALPTLGVDLEYDNFPPKKYFICEYYKNSLFVVYQESKTYLNFSKLFRPEQFPLQFRVGLGDNADEEIVCVVKFYDYLVIGTKDGIWAMSDHPLNGGFPYRVTGYVGMVNNKAFAILDNQFVFLGTDRRIYALDPTQFSKVDVRPRYISQAIEPVLKSINPGAIAQSVGTFHHVNDRYEIYMSVPQGSNTECDTVLVMDATEGGWTIDEKRVSAFGRVTNANNEITLYHGDENGYLYVNDIGEGYGAEVSGTVDSATANTLTDNNQADIISTATAGGAVTLTDATQTMTVNRYAGEQIYIRAGTGAGQYNTILSNTATVFTVTTPWGVVPDNTSQYIVGGFLQNALNGLDLDIIDGTGENQRRIVLSHTPITITVSTNWDTTPDNTSVFTVGGIDFYVWTGWDQHTPTDENTKRGWLVHLNTQNVGTYNLNYAYARDQIYTAEVPYTVALLGGGFVWGGGSSIWGSAYWGVSNSFTSVVQFQDGSEYYQRLQHRFRNRFPGQPITVNYVTTSFQDKGIMLAN